MGDLRSVFNLSLVPAAPRRILYGSRLLIPSDLAPAASRVSLRWLTQVAEFVGSFGGGCRMPPEVFGSVKYILLDTCCRVYECSIAKLQRELPWVVKLIYTASGNAPRDNWRKSSSRPRIP